MPTQMTIEFTRQAAQGVLLQVQARRLRVGRIAIHDD
jgi:hypothetical protein